MLQNKIYHNFFFEILKTFITIVIGLSLIAFTVRAVNFLELIVDNGYSLSTYFKYSILNVFGIALKFFPIAFLIAIILFIVKHKNNSEFIILWTAGVKKKVIINLLLISSFIIMIFYLIFSIYFTPLALSKSRELLSQNQFNSFLPTIRSQQFSDSFKDLTFFVEEKIDNEVKNIFLHDTGKSLNRFSSKAENVDSTTIIASKGIVDKKAIFLLEGQIISYNSSKGKNEIIKFDQLNIDLNQLKTTVIKKLKLQETSTFKLLNCFTNKKDLTLCTDKTKEEIIPVLMRRLVLPAYLPIIALICSFLLIKNYNLLLNRTSVFFYGFILLVFIELLLKYTGTNNFLKFFYMATPIFLLITLYPLILYKFSK